jgi:hypothetical protein
MAGKIVADQIEHSTAGSLDTQYVVNGSAKHWANISNGGTVEDSFNQSSIVDNNPADCTYNFSSNLSNGLYANSGLTTYDISTNPFRTLAFYGTDPTSGLFRTKGFYSTTLSPNDMTTSTVMTHGELA